MKLPLTPIHSGQLVKHRTKSRLPEVSLYFGDLLEEKIMTETIGYRIVPSSYHGDGIIAAKEFIPQDLIFSEIPFFFLQSLPNRQHVLTCSNCYRFLGSIGLQMKYLQKEITRQQLSECSSVSWKEYQSLSEEVLPCVHSCGELYCSLSCQQDHWQQKGHCLLCTGQIKEDELDENALYQLKIFMIQSNEIFLMIAEIIAQHLVLHDPQLPQQQQQQQQQQTSTSSISWDRKDAVAIFERYVRNIWWEAIDLPKHPNKKKQLQSTLRQLVNGLWEHLNETFQLKEKGYDTLFTKEWIARTIGMFEQNNVGVRVENPIAKYLKNVDIDKDPGLVEELFQEIEKIRDSLEDGEDCCDETNEVEQDDEEEADAGKIEGIENDEEAVMEVDSIQVEVSKENKSIDGESKNYQQRWEELKAIIEEENEENLFPPLDGTAFFILTCKINHSCDPNVRVTYHIHPEKGLELQMVAIQEINGGEELVQSYIDQFQPKRLRQKALKDYGFVCQCLKCTEES